MKLEKRFVISIIGASGTGKTTLACKLDALRLRYKNIPSITTRPKRYNDEEGHLFYSLKQLEAKYIVDSSDVPLAEAWFHGNYYTTDLSQIKGDGVVNLMVLDPAGAMQIDDRIDYIKNIGKELVHYKVLLVCDEEERISRIKSRPNTSLEFAKDRVNHDKQMFNSIWYRLLKPNLVINTEIGSDEVVDLVRINYDNFLSCLGLLKLKHCI